MPVQQAPVHRHLKWAEGTAAETSGKDGEIINQRSYLLVTCLVSSFKPGEGGAVFGLGEKEVTGCRELCRTLA